MNWMVEAIKADPSLQEFIEKAMGYLFNLAEDEDILEDLADEMGTDRAEIELLFQQLGYDRHDGMEDE